jgi:hypothetical protein
VIILRRVPRLNLGSVVRPVEVCLVRSPTVTSIGAVGQDAVPPLGLAYIADSLRKAGHHVRTIDGVGEAVHQYSRVPWHARALMHGLRLEEIVERIDRRTEVVGKACMFSVEWLVVKHLAEASSGSARTIAARSAGLLSGEATP